MNEWITFIPCDHFTASFHTVDCTQFLKSLFTLAPLPHSLLPHFSLSLLCLISSSHSLFYYLPLNVGFLLTTLFYLFMKNIHLGNSSKYPDWAITCILNVSAQTSFTLHWWCAAASQLLHFQELCEPAAKPSPFIINLHNKINYSKEKNKGNKYLKLITS